MGKTYGIIYNASIAFRKIEKEPNAKENRKTVFCCRKLRREKKNSDFLFSNFGFGTYGEEKIHF